jgi:SSS family solute:Na+ symporter
MNSSVILILVSTIVVLGITSLVAIYIGKKKKSQEDWAVGGRSLPIYVIVGTMYATSMGGGTLVAHVGIAYTYGWSALSYGLIFAGGIAFLAVIANWLREQKFTTVPDVIAKFYGDSKVLLVLASVASILVPLGWMCTNLVAFGKLYSAITGLSVPLLMTIFAIISLAFVLPSGLTSVAWTDFIFGCFMFSLTVFSVYFALKIGGGWANIVAKVPPEITAFPGGMKAVGWATIGLWSLSILPGSLTNQMYYQRIFAIDNVKAVRRSLIISAIIVLTADVWTSFMGITIRSLKPGLAPELASGFFLTQVPVWFLAIYSAFLCATIMSTIDSGIQSVAVNITSDIYHKLVNKEATDKNLTKYSRIFSVASVALALALALWYPQALGWLLATWAYSAAALFFPIFMGYFFRNTKVLNAWGAVASMIGGVIGVAIATVMKVTIPVAYGLIGSLVCLFLVSYLTKKQSPKVIASNN